MIDNILIKDYTYDLPEGRIAKAPLENRDESKLLIYRNGRISHNSFKNIKDYLPENNLLVRNNTRVIQARLNFRKTTGANIEVFCLEPMKPASYELNFSSTGPVEWECLVGNAKKWKSEILETQVVFEDKTVVLKAEKTETRNGNFRVKLDWDGEISFAEILEYAGSTPIPPYLRREAEQRDKKWYQTVYALYNGSVAAPTAGLHFTSGVFDSLRDKNIQLADLTLHVGAGTFRPVQTEKISDHDMHLETMQVTKSTIEQLFSSLESGITAVGTTSLRTLESLYWLGVKMSDSSVEPNRAMRVEQWDPYQDFDELEPGESLGKILEYLDTNSLNEINFATRLIIVPGYEIRIANRLITNFHQPGSTLLLLVAAFIGDDWRKVYDYALNNDFRFLSYGDSSILELRK